MADLLPVSRLAELEALALACPEHWRRWRGPLTQPRTWVWSEDGEAVVAIAQTSEDNPFGEGFTPESAAAHADFIAGANPHTVLALVGELTALRSFVDSLGDPEHIASYAHAVEVGWRDVEINAQVHVIPLFLSGLAAKVREIGVPDAA